MSAVFGILRHHGHAVDQNELQRMAKIMSHRGPDDQGFWLHASTGIGHAMFQTTPESLHEQLPFQDSESGLVITADARIDNREELAKSPGLNQAIKQALPDSHFILEAYKKWGERCINHLLGDFSFAIWDEREKRLFCARDHMGIKPFNYYSDNNIFAFASEVQAILEVSGVPRNFNEGRIADALVTELEGIDKTSTFFEGIYRLPPAHTLLVENGRVSKQCYWEPDPEKRIILASDDDYVSAFTEIYTDAIDKRLRGNGDVASMLSGGMDSSSIVGIARDLHLSKTGQAFPVFSAISPTDKQDCRDTHFINSMLKQGGLASTTISTDDLEHFNQDIRNIVEKAQEPFDPMIMIIAIYLQAKQTGFRVMLDGIDGDVIASLSSSYPAILLRNKKYREAISEMLMQNTNYYGGKYQISRILYQNLRAAYTPSILRKLRQTWRKHSQLKLRDDSLINTAFAKEINLTDRLAQLHAHGASSSSKSTHAQHVNSILHPYLTVALERYDRVAALCGIEARHPLLDKRIIEFMVAIPWNQKVRSGWNKYLLRKSAELTLPSEVCWRQGWEHVGWDFECSYLQTNRASITSSIKPIPKDLDQYLNINKLTDIIESYSFSNEESNSIIEALHFVNWIKSESNEKIT